MFDRVSIQLLRSLPARVSGAGARHTFGELISLALAIALVASAGLAVASPPGAYAAGDTTEPSIQYLEAVAHAGQNYTFAPGGDVTVAFRPRPGDSTMVDGAAPVALPAAQGRAGVAPNLTAPGSVTPNGAVSLLRREVYGFLPYWELGTTLDYDALSTIAYFGIGLNVDLVGNDPGDDGTLYRSGSGWNGWVGSTMTSVINNAHAHGARVALTIQSFAWDGPGRDAQTHLLSTPAASLTAAQQIAAEVGRRGADGVNLDFEPIAPGQSANYIAFVRLLRVELDKVHPGYELTFCATGRPSTYDLANLTAPGAADAVFIMGYDFRGGTPANTGSIDPLTSPWIYDLTDAVNAFKAQAPVSKIILGLPWYGHAWSTGGPDTCDACHAVNAPQANLTTYGQPASVYYSTAADLAAITDSTHLGKLYDTVEQTAWTAYYGTYGGGLQPTWRELYFDDAQAVGVKCDAIDGWNLRGVGIWALGYDNNNGDGDLTHAIAGRFQVSGTTYVPMTPTRLVDTRINLGLTGKLLANTPATFQVTEQGGIPADATAVTGNLTVANPSFAWAIYLGPNPVVTPSTSTLNFATGESKANGVTVALSPTGTLSATYMSTPGNKTDLVFDVTGYFTPETSGATYHSVTPARLLDTRIDNGFTGPISANTPATFQVSGRNGIPPNAIAVTGNVTAVNETFAWAVYVGPDPLVSPPTSTVNFNTGDVKANNLTVALSSTGSLSATYMSTDGNTTDLVFDVTGFYTADATGARFVPLAPVRLLDTRTGNGMSGKISANTPRSFQVTGRGGVPSSATAVSGNVTVVNETASWAIFVGSGPTASPGTSTLNFNKGDVVSNGLAVGLGSGGTLSVTYLSLSGNKTDLVFDVTGYFAP